MWNKIAKIILRYKAPILTIIGIITVFMAYQMKNLRMKYEYAPLMPETDSIYTQYLDFKKIFGEDATMTVVAFEDPNFITLDKYHALNQLQDSLKTIEGVTGTLSYANAITIEKDTTQKKFIAHKIFETHPQTQAQLDSMYQKVIDFKYYQEMLYDGKDCHIVAITCDPKVINNKKRDVMIGQIEQMVEQFAQDQGIQMHISGLPYTRSRLMIMVRDEMVVFCIISILIVAIIMFMFFRSIKTTLITLLIVSIGVIWTLAIMAMFGYEMTMLSGMLPPLLIVIGIPNSVYMLNKYHVEYKAHGNKIKALYRVIIKVGKATFLTNLTTAAGFATFLITGNRMLIEFGTIATIGIVVMFLLSICLVPIIFSSVAPPDVTQTKHLESKKITAIVEKLVYLVENKRPTIYIGTLIVVALACFGLTLMKNESFIVDDLPADNKVYTDLKYFEKHAGGIMPFEISIDTKKQRGLMKIQTLEKIAMLEDSLRYFNCISKATSISDALKIIKRAYYNGNNDFYNLPSQQEMAFILPYLKTNGENNQAAKSLMSSMVDTTFQRARITLRIADIGTARMIRVSDSIQNIIDYYFPPEKNTTFITGNSIIFTKGSLKLIDNLVESLALAIVLISLCMVTLFSSWRMVFVSVLPNFIPLLVTAAIMGFTDIRLKSSTILVFNIAFGISVDNAIHFLTKFRQDLTATNWNVKESVISSLRETSVSIIYSALILLAGFLMFCASQFGGTVALGLLIGLTLFVAMFTNLLFLPSLLMTFKNKFRNRAIALPTDNQIEEQIKRDEI